jgi:hypothetical protein
MPCVFCIFLKCKGKNGKKHCFLPLVFHGGQGGYLWPRPVVSGTKKHNCLCYLEKSVKKLLSFKKFNMATRQFSWVLYVFSCNLTNFPF